MEQPLITNSTISSEKWAIFKTIFLIVGLILALSNNILHSTYLYFSISPRIFQSEEMEWAYSIFVNLVVDFSVIAFAFNKKRIQAGLYAIGILCINLIFWKGVGFIDDEELRKNLARVIYSVMFSYGVYIFTELLAQRIVHKEEKFKYQEILELLQKEQAERRKAQELIINAQEEIKQEQEKRKQAEQQLQEMQSAIIEAQQLMKQAHERIQLYEKERKKELTCDICDFPAQTKKQLSDHRRRKHPNKKSNEEMLAQDFQNKDS